MKALFITSVIAFLLYAAGADSLLTILGPVWFLVIGAAILLTAGVASRD